MRYLLCVLLLACGLATANVSAAKPVNINTATVEELDTHLRGIGRNRAERIVNYRQQHGPFATPEDVMMVPYIGRRLFEANRADIRVE
ncbi:MAG: ComEA family DNA-binding protein [Oceanococcaceae bacterium]